MAASTSGSKKERTVVKFAKKREWRDIDGYKGRYQVSDDGFVRSMADIDYRGKVMPGAILSAAYASGYLVVSLHKRGVTKVCRVHRLVGKAFIPNPDRKPQINHKDGDRANAAKNNLEWSTNAENVRHSYEFLNRKSGLTGKTGILCANSKKIEGRSLATGKVIRFAAAADAARHLKLSTSSGIAMAASGKMKSAYGYVWRYI